MQTDLANTVRYERSQTEGRVGSDSVDKKRPEQANLQRREWLLEGGWGHGRGGVTACGRGFLPYPVREMF